VKEGKHLAVAMWVVLALALVGASAAQAEGLIEAEEYPATLSGEQAEGEEHLLNFAGRKVTCEAVTFDGTLSAASSEVELAPTYENCHAAILGNMLAATVTTSGCGYAVEVAETQGILPGFFAHISIGCTITVDIYSNNANHIQDTALCRFHIMPQATLSGSKIFYLAAPGNPIRKLFVALSMAGIAYTSTGSTVVCGAASGNAEYTGGTEISAANAEDTAISVEVDD
jgi:hypothetical protein